MTEDFVFFSLRKKFFIFSVLYLLLIAYLIYSKGVNFGIDFTGGNEIEAIIKNHNTSEVFAKTKKINNIIIEQDPTQKNKFIIQTKKLGMNDLQILKDQLQKEFKQDLHIEKTEFIGPQISQAIVKSAIVAIISALCCMFVYLALRFDWHFAIGGIYALFHDVVVVFGFLCLAKIEITAITISAILTIIGYSINDTVVIFDRIRETAANSKKSIDSVIGDAVHKTCKRTLLTSVTTLISAVVLLIIGGEVMQDFSMAMLVGVIVGTFSSIFVSTFALK